MPRSRSIKSIHKNINGQAELYIDRGVFICKYQPGVIIDLELAVKIMEQREELCEGQPMVVIGDGRGVAYWTKKAMDFQSSPRNFKLVKAVAVVYSESKLTNTFINFFKKFTRPHVPLRFFSNMEDAYEWATKFK